MEANLGILLAAILAIAMALSPLVVAITEMLKLTVKGVAKRQLPSELVPALACLVGVGLALLLMPNLASDWRAVLAGGFVAGLVASKLFDVGQARAGADVRSPPVGEHWNDVV